MQIENKGNTLEKTVLSEGQTLCKRPSQNQSDVSQQRLTWNSKRCVSEELKREKCDNLKFHGKHKYPLQYNFCQILSDFCK